MLPIPKWLSLSSIHFSSIHATWVFSFTLGWFGSCRLPRAETHAVRSRTYTAAAIAICWRGFKAKISLYYYGVAIHESSGRACIPFLGSISRLRERVPRWRLHFLRPAVLLFPHPWKSFPLLPKRPSMAKTREVNPFLMSLIPTALSLTVRHRVVFFFAN